MTGGRHRSLLPAWGDADADSPGPPGLGLAPISQRRKVHAKLTIEALNCTENVAAERQARSDQHRAGGRAERHRYAYFPFGAGTRICIGEHFAWMEAILALSTIAQRWQLRLVPGQKIEMQPIITLRPKGGIKMMPVPS